VKNKLLYFFVIIAFLFQIPITHAKKPILKASTSRFPKVQFNTTNNQESLSLIIKEIGYKLIEDSENTSIQIEGFEQYMSPGNPILPHRVFRVALPPNINLETVQAHITIREQDTFYITKPIKPAPSFMASSKNGQIISWGQNKDIDKGYNLKVYSNNGFFPQQAVNILSCSTMRRWKIVEVEFFPVFYNPITNQVQVIKEADIGLSYDITSKTLSAHSVNLSDTCMDETASKLLDNYIQSRTWYESEEPATQSGSDFEYIIITTENIKNGSNKLDEFEDFKETQGFNVLTVTENSRYEDIDESSTGSGWGGSTGDTAAENIRSWLSTNYSSIGIEQVLLIGDPTPSNGNVPMKMCWPRNNATFEITLKNAPTDYYFADLTGNWDLDGDGDFGEYPDDFGANGVDKAIEVYVGRIPVYGTAYTTLDNILNKIIDYGSDVGEKGWREKVLLPMEPSDDITDGYPLGEGIRNDYATGAGWSSYRIYDENYDCFPEETPCNPTNVENEWQNNYGLVTWMTHGSETVASDVFSTSQCNNLDDNHPSFTFQCSCLNGYPETTNNLGYSLLVNGAVGTISASRLSWYLPGNSNWNRNGTNSYLAYEYSGKIIDGFRCGKALYDVKMATFSGDAEYWMNLLVFNLYGDPSLGINDPTWQNNSPVLSNPRVSPVSGTESTNFEFMVDYYDPDGDPPDSECRRVYISGLGYEQMTLKIGSASNGIYHYTTTLPTGLYSYMFLFADELGLWDTTSWQSGPSVYSDGDAVINITIQCTNIACDLRLKYSLTGSSGPWTEIPITQAVLEPLLVPSGSTVYFQASTESANYEYREWELRENGNLVGGNTSSSFSFTLGPSSTEVGLNVYYHYTPQNYTISGTVLREDSSPVPGGVDFTLSSSQQNIALHTDNGNFSFAGINGGVTVTVTPSANGYVFAPANLVYECMDDNHIGETIAAYSSDDYAPRSSFISVPPAVSENSIVSFSWIGEDDISAPANLLYQYKLDGVDTDWSVWTSDTSKVYDLENGAYTFWVRAQDEALNINQAPASYKFVINAAPKVTSAVRINRSVWASRVTLEMPIGASHPNDIFVLLPEHSGIGDPELVPVTIHRSGEITPCGASEYVAAELAITERITKTSTGYLVSLPNPVADGQTAKYDIVWGKIKYFGWKESVSIPSGFPSGGSAYNAYLDDALRVWRSASRRVDRAGGLVCGYDAWMYMDICNQSGIITDETTLRFVRGQCLSGDIGASTQFNPYSVFKAGDNIYYLWKDYRYEYDGSTDYRYGRYGLQIFDDTGKTVNSADGTYYDKASFTLPSSLIHGGIWITAKQDIGSHYYDPDEAWFLVLSQNGNEIITKTVFDTIQNPNGSCIDVFGAYPLGNNIVFLWTRQWDTANGRMRQEIAYQVRNINGQLVKATTILSPPLLPDSTSANDLYSVERVAQDKNGKLWVTINRGISGPDEYYYVILGTDGNVWKGPVQTSYLRCFEYCDKDGYIWANENGQFLALNPDDTIAILPRTGAWNPNQTMGLIAASVSTSGYRLYDRWSPQTIGIDVPADVNANLIQLFDLNLWGNNLHPANINITKGATSVWSQTGQFTGHAAVDVSSILDEGQNMLTITQDDFLGGQLLLTFPYNYLVSDITGDGKVNFEDLKVIANQWLQQPGIPSADIAPQPDGDDIVNFLDFAKFASNWLDGVE